MKTLTFTALILMAAITASAQHTMRSLVNEIVNESYGTIFYEVEQEGFTIMLVELPEYYTEEIAKLSVKVALNQFDGATVHKPWQRSNCRNIEITILFKESILNILFNAKKSRLEIIFKN